MNIKNIFLNKYFYVIILAVVFILILGDGTRILETRISNITKDDGINSTLKLGKAIFDKVDVGKRYIMSDEEIYEAYNIKRLEVKNVTVYTSIIDNKVNEIAIIEYDNEKQKQLAIEKLNFRLTNLEEKWKIKDSKEVEKIKNSIIEVKNPYIVLIISDNAKNIKEEFVNILNELEK